jgi:putative ABC transport system permease protein
MTTGPATASAATRLYRALLVVCPPAFRAAYGAEMTRLFRERCDRATTHGRARFARIALAGFSDLLTQGLSARTETVRAATRRPSMTAQFIRDVRLAARTLVRQPGYALTVVITLALGLAATTAALAVLDAAVLRPLPFPAPHRLVSIVQGDQAYGTPFAPPYLADLRDRTTSFETVAGFSPSWGGVLTAPEERAVTSCYVSDGALETLGIVPIAGRLFRPEEHQSPEPVALVSESFFRSLFGQAAVLDGQRISFGGAAMTIVGIVSSDLRMPIMASIVNPRPQPADIWLPFRLNQYWTVRSVPVMNVVGRLREGVTVADAGAELAIAAANLAREYPEMSGGQSIRALPLRDVVAGPIQSRVALALLAVACLLLIGCANVTNLVLARASARQNELAVRASLGATRTRLVSQLLAESVVLSLAGTVAGVALAAWMLAATPALLVEALPPSAVLTIGPRVVAAAAIVGFCCAALVGLFPALKLSKDAPARALGGGLRTTSDAAARRLRSALVVVEVALALMLLVGAGLMAASFWKLSRVDPGFDVQPVFSTGVAFGGPRYAAADARRAFVDDAVGRLAALPGVETAAAVNRLPLSGANTFVGIEVEGAPTADGRPITVDRRVVTPAYFDAIGIAVVAGRAFALEDRFDSEDRVAIVNQAAARTMAAGGDPLNRRLRLMLRGGPGPWLRVVGVVDDVRHHGLAAPAAPEVYVPYAQAPVESMVFVLRSATPDRLAAPVKATLKAIDPHLPVLANNQAAMSTLVGESLARPRVQAAFVNAFGAVALALAAIGIYGVVSYTVARMRRDIGVHMALGARRRDVLVRILRRQMLLVGAGIALGVAGAGAAARLLETLLFGVSATDPATFAGVSLLLAVVALVAAWLPARRATLIDPVVALRPE